MSKRVYIAHIAGWVSMQILNWLFRKSRISDQAYEKVASKFVDEVERRKKISAPNN